MPATRISGACVGCRAKKQKCSGNRSGCAQCLAAGIECVWPEQRKRGPAKGYIEALEQRLHAAELLLLGLLPHVDDALLQEATSHGTQQLSRATSESSGGDPEDRRASRSSPTPVNKKTGVEYWENFALDSVVNIRRWQQNCEEHSSVQSQTFRMRSQSQTQLTGAHQQYQGSEERRQSATAAMTIAGMRHSTTSPGTPNSGSGSSMMAMAGTSRPMYGSSISTGQTTNLPSNLAQSQQMQQLVGQPPQQMWYQPFQQQPQTRAHPMSMGMDLGVDQNYAQSWSDPQQANTAMDVDTSAMVTNLAQQQHPQGPPGSQPGDHPGLYQGDFSQNIFW